MKRFYLCNVMLCLFVFASCNNDDNTLNPKPIINTAVNFSYKTTINVGGEGASEISAYDPLSKKIFTVNVESNQISVFNISDLNAPQEEIAIDVSGYGTPNSVAIKNGKLAVAVEAKIKQNPGKILLFSTNDNALIQTFTVGALPDMVTFTKNGNTILSANEGEPNNAYTVDPEGSVSIIDINTNKVTTLNFEVFNSQQAHLEENGFRVFGPNASLSIDVEPEYIAVSDDSKTAWVSLQENNGLAKINIETKTIEAIYPFGFKDYNLEENSIDPSDKDNKKALKPCQVKGMYQPDGITYVNINGTDYIVTANEGDSRDYEGFSEEKRIKKLDLDTNVFNVDEAIQADENLGRLQVTTTLGDANNDGKYEDLYSFGARSFSIWTGNGELVYDSGNSIAIETLKASPERFNNNDSRSDAKGAEPETVEVLNMGNQRFVLFVGLERNNQVLVYDITNPIAPQFLSILEHEGDEAPEGILIIPASESPTGKDVLVVSNEGSGTLSFYENLGQ